MKALGQGLVLGIKLPQDLVDIGSFTQPRTKSQWSHSPKTGPLWSDLEMADAIARVARDIERWLAVPNIYPQ